MSLTPLPQHRHRLQQHLPLHLPEDPDGQQHRCQGDGPEEEQEEELCARQHGDDPRLLLRDNLRRLDQGLDIGWRNGPNFTLT